MQLTALPEYGIDTSETYEIFQRYVPKTNGYFFGSDLANPQENKQNLQPTKNRRLFVSIIDETQE